MRFLTLLGIATLLAATACSSDDDGGGGSGTDHATFSDGARADVGSDGSIAISVDGKTVLSLAGGIRLARYDETSTSLLGMWSFVRDGEESVTLNHFESGKKSGDSFVATLTGDGGAKAKVTISPLREGASLVRIEASGYDGLRSIALPFACDPEASFYGFGEQYNAVDQRGEAFPLFVSEQGIGREGPAGTASIAGNAHTTYYPMPYFVDARGFGALLRTGARVLADVCQTDRGRRVAGGRERRAAGDGRVSRAHPAGRDPRAGRRGGPAGAAAGLGLLPLDRGAGRPRRRAGRGRRAGCGRKYRSARCGCRTGAARAPTPAAATACSTAGWRTRRCIRISQA